VGTAALGCPRAAGPESVAQICKLSSFLSILGLRLICEVAGAIKRFWPSNAGFNEPVSPPAGLQEKTFDYRDYDPKPEA